MASMQVSEVLCGKHTGWQRFKVSSMQGGEGAVCQACMVADVQDVKHAGCQRCYVVSMQGGGGAGC